MSPSQAPPPPPASPDPPPPDTASGVGTDSPRRWLWPLLTAAIAVMLWVLSGTPFVVPAPVALLLVTVFVAALRGGWGPGLASATVLLAYEAWVFSAAGYPWHYGGEDARRAVEFAVLAAGAVFVGARFYTLLARERAARELAEGARRAAERARARAEESRAAAEDARRNAVALQGRAEAAQASAEAAERTAADYAGRLAATEARARMLVEQVKEYAIFMTDVAGRPTSWNEGVGRVFGYTEAEFVGLEADALFTPEDRAAGIPARELETAAREGTASDDRWLVRKGGERFFAQGVTTAVRDEASGRLVGFAKVLRDQTVQRRAEEALRQSETRFRLVAEATREAIWDWDLVTNAVVWNPGVTALFGHPPEEVGGDATWWYDHVHPDDRERVVGGIHRAIDGGARRWSDEYAFRRADGRYALVTDRGVIDRDDRGRGVRMIGTMADITERRRAEQQLAQAQRMEAIGRLAGGIAHDLNNMLVAVIGYSHFLARSLGGDDPRRADVEQVLAAAERSAALTRQLLAFARREHVQPRPLDLNQLVNDAERLFRPALGAHVEVVLDLAPELGPVFADRGQLEQVVLNLVFNARDAIPGGGRLVIETRPVVLGADYAARHPGPTIPPGPYARLAVTDTGHGMDAATLERAFEPFFTTKALGQGTGLGLSTVYGSVKQAGGFVWLYSEPGRGTAVHVYLPIAGELAPGAPAAAAETDPRRTGDETVLIVEDEDAVRALAHRTLAGAGYRCLEATAGGDALRQLTKLAGPLHLLLTDVVMPGMSGSELAREVERLRPGTQVLYMSGYTGDDVVRRGLMGARQPFVQKPFTPDGLLAKVRAVLDGAPAGGTPGGGTPADAGA